MTPFVAGFSDELVKLGGAFSLRKTLRPAAFGRPGERSPLVGAPPESKALHHARQAQAFGTEAASLRRERATPAEIALQEAQAGMHHQKALHYQGLPQD
jgi:hypothetical protein